MPEFDVVVLGGGTAGLHVAAEVAAGGRSVALVEAGRVGGEPPSLACLPSKTLLEAAGRGEAWENAVARRDEVTSHLDDSSAASRLTEAGVTLLRGTGQVTRPGTVQVTTYSDADPAPDGVSSPGQTVELTYTDLVLSTGSEPVAPPIEGLADIAAWTSAGALRSPDLPRRLVVLGGGSGGRGSAVSAWTAWAWTSSRARRSRSTRPAGWWPRAATAGPPDCGRPGT